MPDPAPTVPDPTFWAGRRVLVTGHTGFKGAWLSLWLASLGARVTGFGRGAPTDPSLYALARVGDDLEHREGDIRDAEALAGTVAQARPEVVLHLAAQPFVRRSYREPLETYAINTMGTAHVLDAVRRAPSPPRAVVVVTTDKCYDNPGGGAPLREDARLGGHDPYSSSKGAAELITAAYRSSYFADPDGPQIASARAGNVFGGGDWGEDRLLPDVIGAILAGEPVSVRRPDAVRPWQHVLNPLSGYLRLAERLWDDPSVARPFNFGPAADDARPVRQILERLDALWDGPVRWELDRGPHPPEAGWLALDSALAAQRLGWTPGWELDAGLRHTVDWYRAWHDGADVRAATLGQITAFG